MATATEWEQAPRVEAAAELTAAVDDAADTWLDLEPMSTEAALAIVRDQTGRADLADRPPVLPPPTLGPSPMLARYEIGKRVGGTLGGDLVVAQELQPGRASRPCVLECFAEDDVNQELLDDWQLNLSLRHPHLVRVYDCGTLGEKVCLSRELVPGSSLRALMKAGLHRRLSPGSIVYLAWQLADALAYAAEKNPEQVVLHGSLCPSDVLISHDGTAKITPVSSSGSAARRLRLARAHQPWRLDYMTTQQRAGCTDDTTSDVYALGLVLAELLGAPRASAQDTSTCRDAGPPEPPRDPDAARAVRGADLGDDRPKRDRAPDEPTARCGSPDLDRVVDRRAGDPRALVA